MKNSDTPRVDAEIRVVLSNGMGPHIVDADFARTLERENVTLQAQNTLLRQGKEVAENEEITKLKKEIALLQGVNSYQKGFADGEMSMRLELEETIINVLQSRLTETEKMVVALKESLKQFGSGVDFFSWGKVKAHLPVPLAKQLTLLQCEVDQLLSQVPQSLAHKYVKREVLERLYRAIDMHGYTDSSYKEAEDAMIAARAELSSTSTEL
jgi:hypothetical protein